MCVWWMWRAPAQTTVSDNQQRIDLAHGVGMDPDDILVDFVDDIAISQVEAVSAQLGISLQLVSNESVNERLYRAHILPERRDEVLLQLKKLAVVEIAEPDALFQLTPFPVVQAPLVVSDTTESFPNDPLYKHQWHLDQIGMQEAWKLADGNEVIVAVLDTGVAYKKYGNDKGYHKVSDLRGIKMVAPYNFVDNNKHAVDDHGHGTHVAGTIAQATNNKIGVAGVALNVRIMPLKVLSGSGSGSVAGIADAIHYAADNGAKVINMSLGGRFPSAVLKKAVQYAYDKGVVVVCAAGNEGRNKVGYPAGYPGAIAVAATQFDEATTFYSNYGKSVDIAAPGGNTRIDQNGDGMPDGVLQNTIAIGDPSTSDYFGYMGTSMASPHIAGVAALLVGEGVTNPKAVENILYSTAREPNGQEYKKNRYGAGIVDTPAAIRKATSEQGGWQFVLGLLLAGGVLSSLRNKGKLGNVVGPGLVGGTLLGASGLFFLPYLSPEWSQLPVVDMLTRGIPSWDMDIFGVSSHGNLLFFSALIPFVLLVLTYSVEWLRIPVAGLALGIAGHLLFHALTATTDIQYVPHWVIFDSVWLIVNVLLCLGMASLALRE